jgi:hypothetical protein
VVRQLYASVAMVNRISRHTLRATPQSRSSAQTVDFKFRRHFGGGRLTNTYESLTVTTEKVLQLGDGRARSGNAISSSSPSK